MQTLRSPWLVLTLGLIGLSIGYTAVLVQNGTAFAGVGLKCSAPLHQCANGECLKKCDGNCDMHNQAA